LYYAFIYAIIYVIIILLPSLYSAESENGLFNYGWPARTAPLAYLGLGT
jgi:DHA1 family multidrug resistance protein-like MFS transporter